MQKSISWMKQKKKENNRFWHDKIVTALKTIAWLFSFHHIKKRLDADYTLPVKPNWKVFKFIEIKICF